MFMGNKCVLSTSFVVQVVVGMLCWLSYCSDYIVYMGIVNNFNEFINLGRLNFNGLLRDNW